MNPGEEGGRSGAPASWTGGRVEELFEAAFRISPMPMAITTVGEGRCLAANDAWLRFYGLTREGALGRTTAEMGIWVDPAERARLVAALGAEGTVRTVRARFHVAGGRIAQCLLSADRLRWSGEEALIAAVQELTDAEAARREAQEIGERFARLFEVAPWPLSVVRLRDDVRLLVNTAWVALTGFPREEVVGASAAQTSLWLEPVERAATIAELKAKGIVRDRVARLRTRDGELRTALVSAALFDWEGEDCMLTALHDVTELERARAEAHAAHARVEAILSHAPVSIAITTRAEGRFRFVNPAWTRMYGYPAEGVAGLAAGEIGFWKSPEERRRVLAPLLERGEPLQIEHRFAMRDGRALDVLMACTPIEFDGEACIVSIVQDITALAEARRVAREESERFAKTFAVSPVPLAIADAATARHIEVNQAWQQFFGWSRGEAIGRSALEMGLWVNPEERARLVAALAAGRAVRGEPCRLRRRSGETAEVLYSADLLDWRGEPALLVALQDVTELRRAHDEIRQLYEQMEDKVRQRTAELEKALSEIEAFSYTVSHDLRAPLRHLAGFAALLLERPPVRGDAQAADYAARLAAAARRMGDMVDSLLEYSRLGRSAIRLSEVDLGAEARFVAAELDAQVRGRRVRWEIGPLPVVRGDATLLRLLLQNLLDNAVKYTRPRPEARIEVGARREGAEWVVHVRDNGVGFDMGHAGKLFGVFQRLHAENDFEGTGIGLAHAARIVERHGGRIWCEAQPGRGATFRFTLPA